MNLFTGQHSATEAAFSSCRRYRYTLWRVWGADPANFVQIIGLNPSTADETHNDNTLRKCVKLAKLWGFDALCMTNLFGFRATDPRVMKQADDPVGTENDIWLRRTAGEAKRIVAAWGNHGTHRSRAAQVITMLGANLYCLRVSALGNPEHPLYQKDTTIHIPFNPKNQ